MQHVEPGEIDIAAIHDVDRARFGKQQSLPRRRPGRARERRAVCRPKRG
jgi:hypothetical protein